MGLLFPCGSDVMSCVAQTVAAYCVHLSVIMFGTMFGTFCSLIVAQRQRAAALVERRD